MFLLVIAVAFLHEILRIGLAVPSVDGKEVILVALSLIALVLVADLLVMVMLSGYENFIAKMSIAEQNLVWLGQLDIGSIKLKITGAIVAISSINLLHAYMEVTDVADDKLMWLVIIHLTFVVSALALTAMDRMPAKSGGFCLRSAASL